MSSFVKVNGVWRITAKTSGGRGTRVRVKKSGVWVDSLENLQSVFYVKTGGVWRTETVG